MKILIIVLIILLIVHIVHKRKENKKEADIKELEYWDKVFKRGKFKPKDKNE